jgi:ssDNA-binding Zn-finger/Zn-ribbon topoisomerase 1
MSYPIILLALCLLIFALYKVLGKRDEQGDLPLDRDLDLTESSVAPKEELEVTYKYKKIDRIVSPAERSFLGVLNQVLDDSVIVLTKVRVADVLTPIPTANRSYWKKAFNSISSKHFDFVLCKADDLTIICAVELNDKSHAEAERKKRDEFIRKACSSASLPLIEVPAKNGYVIQEVTDLISPLIEGVNTHQKDVVCDQCNSKMTLRVTKKGPNKGKTFYGCTNFPTCKNIKGIDSQAVS